MTVDELAPLLGNFGDLRAVGGSGPWEIQGPGLIVPLRPEHNGYISIDIVSRAWPDHMGDPQTDPMLFGAWSMGHFGPFAYPGGFERACQHAWRWPDVRERRLRHDGFIRLQVSYAFGAREDDPVIPPDYSALAELEFLTEVTKALIRHDSVVAYFNASGEVLLSPELFLESVVESVDLKLPALDVWSNIRFFNLGGIADGWFLLDTVGMWQLDGPDHEAFVPAKRYDFGKVDNFLRNASLYVLEHGQCIEHGDTMDGPGGVRWQAAKCEDSFTSPPREVLRWFPLDGSEPSDTLAPVLDAQD